MLMTLLLPAVSGIQLEDVTLENDCIDLRLQTTEPQARCPVCGHLSQEVHSHYGRNVADLPWAGMPVRAAIWVRRFFCRNADCQRPAGRIQSGRIGRGYRPEPRMCRFGPYAIAYSNPTGGPTLEGYHNRHSGLGDTDRFNTYWRNLSSRFNRLTSKANPGVNLTLQKIGWPQQLLNVRRGGSVGTSNPPQFETIIDNESGLKDWVRLNLAAQPLPVLIVPTSQLTNSLPLIVK